MDRRKIPVGRERSMKLFSSELVLGESGARGAGGQPNLSIAVQMRNICL
jgi:hypothetical protein